jgi:hypothetical protein
VLPAGQFELRASFDWNVNNNSAPVVSEVTTFHVRVKDFGEQVRLDTVMRLANLAWNHETQADFAAALLEYAKRQANSDSLDPFLPILTGRMVETARAIGHPPDSTSMKEFNDIRRTIIVARPDDPGGVITLVALYADDQSSATQIINAVPRSLVKDVGEFLVHRLQ